MPAGLQCWDAAGKLIVDIGDYNTRFIGAVRSGMGDNVSQVSVGMGGVTAAGSFAVIKDISLEVYKVGSFAVRCYDGGCNVFKLPAYTAGVNFTVEFYSFI